MTCVEGSSASTDAALSSLTLSTGTLDPVFSADATTYTAAVANNVSSVDVTATAADSHAALAITGPNNSGSGGSTLTAPIQLDVGPNTITVEATAEDGTTRKSYTIEVTRAAPAPTITSVSPVSGNTAGGDIVTIIGTNFTGATGVTFGGVAGTDLTVVSESKITVKAPAHAAGAVNVVVTTSGGDSNAGTYTYELATPTIAVTTDNASPVFGAGVTFTATLTGGASPTGTVTFKDGANVLGTGTISGTTATLTISTLGIGAHSITAVYGGDESNADATAAAITVTVSQPPPTVSSYGPNYGSISGGTTVTITGSNLTGATGVTFGGTAGTDLTVDSDTQITIITPAHPAGAVDITISTPGGQTILTDSFTYLVATPTVTVVADNANPALGAQITLTATLANGLAPSGTVEFFDGATSLGTRTVSGNTAAFQTSSLTFGAHSITAKYLGDTSNAEATSAAVTVTVGQSTPTIAVTADNASPALGATVTFTATLTGGSSPSGTVEFFDGSTSLGTKTLSGTTATLSTAALTVGAHSIAAVYAGDTDNAGATSVAFTVTVGQSAPIVTVTADNASPALGATVTFTATMTGGSSPSGTVEFFDGSTSLGTKTLSGTTATLSTAALTVGAHSITAVYAGDTDNAGATSVAFTVTVGQSAPTVTVSADTASPSLGATVTLTAMLTGGASPAGTVEFFDGSTSLGTKNLSGTTATLSISTLAVGAHSITAVYGGDTNNAGATSTSVTVTVGQSAPAVTVSADNSSPALGASVTLTATLTGGASPTGTVTFKDGTTVLGTGAISGTTATFSTSSLGVGTHSIIAVYAGDADNAGATSVAATVTVGQLAPTVAVSADKPNPAFGEKVILTATLTGGSSPTGTVAFFDGSTSLGNGTVSGTTATYQSSALAAGAHSITAKYSGDANNAAATSTAFSVTVTAAPVATFTFTPAGGTALPAAMAGEDYNQPVSATGGTGALTYSLASGALPKGMVLNISTGELTGPLDAAAEVKDYSFTLKVTDANNATGTASFTIKVTKQVVTVTDKSLDVPAGDTPNNVNLEDGATGGPFSSAETTFVEPANAGAASIVRGEFAAVGPTPLGWYLKFVPNPAYSGQVKVGFKLTSTLGVSNTGTVTYKLGYDAVKVAEKVDSLVHGFVRSRQSMIASSIKVPGLLERRQMERATDPVTARMMPSEHGMNVSLSTSLAQMEAARDNADGISGGASSPLNVWIDGAFLAHNDKDVNGSKWGSFGMLNLGADYLLSDHALLGLSFHLDRMTDPTDEDATLTGNGWLAGPYASLEIGRGVFWNASLLYGGSTNTIDTTFWNGGFETTRWMADTSITGEWALDETTTLSPKLRAVYFSETVGDYTVKNASGDTIGLDGFDEEQFRVSLGAEIARSFTLESGATLTPKLGVTGGFSGLDGTGAFGSFTAGLTLKTANDWSIDTDLLFNIEGDGEKSVGAKAGVSRKF